MKQELTEYLDEVMKINTDNRLNKLIISIGNRSMSGEISKVIAVKLYDDKFLLNLDNNVDVINFKKWKISTKNK